jgi:hypothetical protein
MRSTDGSTARPHHGSSAAARRFAGRSSSLDGAAPAGAWESRTPHRRPAWPGAAEADPASSLALVVILAVIPPGLTRPNQTGFNRIAAQPDLARPYWTGLSGRWAVTKGNGSSWIFGSCLTCPNAVGRVQHPAFSLVSPNSCLRSMPWSSRNPRPGPDHPWSLAVSTSAPGGRRV